MPKDDTVLDECKALANETRLNILEWLKNPGEHWGDGHDQGVCVGLIQQRAGCSASTVSVHLAILQRAGFVSAAKRGQWTYYRRNEDRIRAFAERLHRDL